ncbi:MAG TPA: hypothetical protein VI011_18915 [Asanoa sp.]
MARIEDLLREEFRRADRLAAPGRDAMLARVTKARRRRTAGAAAGCGLVLVGLAVTVVVTVQPGTAGTQFGGGFQPRLYQAELINAVFTDRRHGYVVQQRCSMDVPGDVPAGAPTPDVHEECAAQLLVTADAGHTWRARTLPGDPATKDAGVDLFLGHSLMLWVDGTGKLAFGGWDRRYWTTADGGSSWRESASPRDTGPAGSFGTFGADDRLTFLASPPPDPMVGKNPSAKNPIVPATDGSFWLACSDGPCVHVTRDHGVTWQTLPTVDSAADVEWVATSDGRTVTASVRTAAGSRLLVRSTDAGSTWTTVLGLAQAGAAGLALPNGDVILAEASAAGGVYRLKAGGSALERLTDAPAHVNALYATGGVVVAAPTWDQREDPDLESVVSVSADGGTTWTAVPAP